MLKTAMLVWVLGAAVAVAQTPASTPDLQDLPRLKDFSAARVSSNNPDPDSNDDSWRPIAGETVTLADLDRPRRRDPHLVDRRRQRVRVAAAAAPARLLRRQPDRQHRLLRSAISSRVGHGFERPVNSLMVRDGSSGRSRNSYWQMPFARRVRITVTNEGRRRVVESLLPRRLEEVAGAAARHRLSPRAVSAGAPAAAGHPYEILSVTGRGHYVGTVFSIVQNQPGWFGEGDEHFYVDGAARASIEGTGTEDYFNDAWSFRVSDGLYTGVPVADGTGVGARMSAYRWHVVDPVPFRRSLRLDIEHKGWTYNAGRLCAIGIRGAGAICSAASRSGTRTVSRSISPRSRTDRGDCQSATRGRSKSRISLPT